MALATGLSPHPVVQFLDHRAHEALTGVMAERGGQAGDLALDIEDGIDAFGGLRRSGNAACAPRQGLQLFERALRHGCTALGESSKLAIPNMSHPRTERMASHRKEDETAGAGFVLGCRHYLRKNNKLPSFAALRRVGRGAASEPKEQCADKGLPRHRRLGVPVSFILPSTRTPKLPAETTSFPSRPASQPQMRLGQFCPVSGCCKPIAADETLNAS